MLKHHGIFYKEINGKKHPQVHFEIWALFNCLNGAENFQPRLTSADLEIYYKSIGRLEFHFREVLHQFVFLLDLFQYNIILFETCLNTENQIFSQLELSKKTCGVTAQSIIVTLNVLLDDIARLVDIVYENNILSNEKCAFTKTKNSIIKDCSLYDKDLQDLFLQLDIGSSWWNDSFLYQEGMRQRLVHHQDTLNFQGSGKNGGLFKAQCFLMSLYSERKSINYVENLRKTNYGLCDFLDKLYEILYKKLQSRFVNLPEGVVPCRYGHFVKLPTFFTEFKKDGTATRTYPDEDYLYLPLVEGA